MIIPKDTPFKVLKYLSRLNDANSLPARYEKEKVIIYLVDNNYIIKKGKGISASADFTFKYGEFILPFCEKIHSFIDRFNIQYIEDYCTIFDFECLIQIEEDRDKLIEFTFQQILTKYFKSSKYTKKNSNLATAIKAVVGIEYFIEDDKDQQFLRVLYPKNKTRFIILCENIDRLRNPRHEFIEFWYAGGRNTIQLQFIPKPAIPILYLFDWDFDGLNIYNHIKQNYFPTLTAFIPTNYESLMEKQDEVRHHRSKWGNDNFLQYLTDNEKNIAETLIKTNSIIEEQKIHLTTENLINNAIN
jgi:hypothetical protein